MHIEVRDGRKGWPFPAIHEASKEPNVWTAISEETGDELLCALPPIYVRGGFLMGEEASHTPAGEPVYTAVIRLRDYGVIVARDIPRSEADQVHDRITEAIGAGRVTVVE